jgi:hypothetical protein
MLIIVLPNYSLDDVWDIWISFFGAISIDPEGRHATATRDLLNLQMLQTRQTLLNPKLLGKLEFPEPFRGLGITDSALADSRIIQAGFRQDSSRIRQNQASHLRLHRPTSLPHFRMCFSPYLASKTSSI